MFKSAPQMISACLKILKNGLSVFLHRPDLGKAEDRQTEPEPISNHASGSEAFNRRGFQLVTVVTGQHLSGDGQTYQELCQLGIRKHDLICFELDDAKALAQSMGNLAAGMGRIIAEETPDIILGLGDR